MPKLVSLFGLGSMLAFPLHFGDHGQREGREAETVLAPRPASQGAQVDNHDDQLLAMALVSSSIFDSIS